MEGIHKDGNSASPKTNLNVAVTPMNTSDKEDM